MPDPWFFCPQPRPAARLRLFCFPYAGSGGMIFRGWQEILPTSVELWTVQYPGRGARLKEAPYTRLDALVEAIARGFVPYLDRPSAFFGHSLGALVSFELARLLPGECRESLAGLMVSGRVAPHWPDPMPPIHRLPKAAFLAELRRLQGTPEEVLQHDEMMQLLLPAIRADFAAAETYTYTEAALLECPVWAFGGLYDPLTSMEGLDAWRVHTRADFSLSLFPGDHFFLHACREQFLKTLSASIENLIHKIT